MSTLRCSKFMVAAGAILLALMSAQAQALTTVNFDPYTPTGVLQAPGSTLFSGDYQFHSSSYSAVVNGSDLPYGVSNGTNMLVFLGVSGELTVSRSDHGLFALSGLDVGGWLGLVASDTAKLSIVGHTQSSGDLTIVSNILPTTSFATLLLPSSFTNLLSLSMTITGHDYPAYAAIDNLILTAVPEAETYAMMLAGLALLGFVARRRTRN